MRFNSVTLIRRIISIAGFSLPISLLILSACGGGGGGGGGGNSHPAPQFVSSGLTVTTFAGVANPNADGIGAAATFKGPYSYASDGTNLFVADSGNHTIRKIVISNGVVSTLAGQAGVAGAADGTGTAATFNVPTGIVIDSANANLYVVDTGNNKIRQVVIATGAVTSLTGTPNAAMAAGAADGPAGATQFSIPRGITADATTLYVADMGNRKIRKVAMSNGSSSSLTGASGVPSAAGFADGANTAATFNNPAGIVIDKTQPLLYVADTNNNKIRQVAIATGGSTTSLTGPVNTSVTAGDVEGPASSASFNSPFGITTDGANLYVADSYNNKIRQIVLATATVTSLTGASGVPSTAGFADGAAASATFSSPLGIISVGNSLYVADYSNNAVRQIAGGVVSTLAGASPGADGSGTAARFRAPAAIASDGVNLYVADKFNSTIRKISISTGAVTTLAGQVGVGGSADGTGTAATFNAPSGIATDGVSLYVTDFTNNKIRKISPSSGSLSAMTSANAVVTSFTGTPGAAVGAGAADGPGASAAFFNPAGITVDGANANLYVADSRNNKIRRIAIATGMVYSVTGASGVPVTAGFADGPASSVSFSQPWGITTDGVSLYVADQGNNKIRQVAIATGAASSVTGASGVQGSPGAADGASASATFSSPSSIFFSGGNLYVTDAGNNKNRMVAIAAGTVSSYTGMANTPGAAGYADGAPSAATFSGPAGICAAGAALYIADTNNNTIRRIQ